MHRDVNFHAFQDAFVSIRPNNFSYDGLRALYDYLIELEDDMGEQMELDVIAFCCEYSEVDEDEFHEHYSDNEIVVTLDGGRGYIVREG